MVADMCADVKTEVIGLDKLGVKPGEPPDTARDGMVDEEGAEKPKGFNKRHRNKRAAHNRTVPDE